MMKKSKLQIVIILIFIFLALHEKSFSVARPVKKVTTKREMAVRGNSFSLTKEIHPVERIGGRKLRGDEEEARKGKNNSKKVNHFVGRRKGGDEQNNFMAFASDYHPPKPHPPKNN